jgi:predicted MFS family arabinose efflux permease
VNRTAEEDAHRASIRSIALLSAAAFGSAATLRVADPLLPQVASEFAVSVGDASVIVTTFAFAYGLCQVLYGPLGDRAGKYRVIAAMTLLSALGAAATGLAQSLAALAVLRLVSGATAAAIIPLAMAHIGDVVPYAQRQTVLARFLSGQILGVIFGQVFGGVFGDTLGWRGIFFALGALFLVVAALLWRELRAGGIAEIRTAPSDARGLAARYLAILRARNVQIVVGTVFVEGFLFYGGFAFFGAFLRHEFAISYALVGLLLGAFGLGGLAYAASVQHVVARLGQRRMVLAGGAFLAAAFAGTAAAPAPWATAPAIALSGLGFYLLHNTLQTAATQMMPEARGLALSVFACSLFLGQAVGVALWGAVIDAAGYGPVFVVTGALLLVLAAFFRAALPLQTRGARP